MCGERRHEAGRGPARVVRSSRQRARYKDAAGLEVVAQREGNRHAVGTLEPSPRRLGGPLAPKLQGPKDSGAVVLEIEVQHVTHLPQPRREQGDDVGAEVWLGSGLGLGLGLGLGSKWLGG